VQIENQTTLKSPGPMCRDQALLHTLASTHTILSVDDGEFVSLIDPPAECQALVAACHNEGTWPVLVGREGEKDAMLSSPITLYDYPQVAAESPGEFFDGTEIDEMLVLRVLTLTDQERRAAGEVDDRARALLTRTRSMSEEQIMGLHGIVRGLRLVPEGN
jgi:hydrogenase maturation protease